MKKGENKKKKMKSSTSRHGLDSWQEIVQANHMRVKVNMDADCPRSIINRKVTFNYHAVVGENLLTWRSKQTVLGS